jgi:hypothetical protein
MSAARKSQQSLVRLANILNRRISAGGSREAEGVPKYPLSIAGMASHFLSRA